METKTVTTDSSTVWGVVTSLSSPFKDIPLYNKNLNIYKLERLEPRLRTSLEKNTSTPILLFPLY